MRLELIAADQLAKLTDEVRAACQTIGFFYIVNHSLSSTDIDQLFGEARRFFKLPSEEKRKLAMANSQVHRGYFGLEEENLAEGTTDTKEGFDLGVEYGPDNKNVLAGLPNYGPNQWPADPVLPHWRSTCETLFAKLLSLGRQLLRVFALSIYQKATFFDHWYEEPMVLLRFLHYVPFFKPTQVGAGEHTDYGFFTLLLQDDIGGLQLQDKHGKWHDAPCVPHAIVVNVGDMVEFLTNGSFRSTLHRVKAPPAGKERFSIPFFFDPHYDTPIAVLPEFAHFKGEVRSKPSVSKYGPHLLARLDASFTYRAASTL